MKKIFFISTNEVWGGSEHLWYESALRFLDNGCIISVAVKYEHKKIDFLKNKVTGFINYRTRHNKFSLAQRIINRVTKIYNLTDLLSAEIIRFNPDMIVISQGNNITSADMMELCVHHNIPFVTVTQLVTDLNWFWLDGELQKRLVTCYEKALKNYFVSNDNIVLHDFLLAYKSTNSELIHNPFGMLRNNIFPYPDDSSHYHAAFVGRIECFHKGLDILVTVLSNEKWKNRNIVFNLYGDGPHVSIIKDLLQQLEINNVHLHGYSASIADVWSANHILILPSRMEGKSLSLLEALNFNRTAIATNVGGATEIIDNNETGFIAAYATTGSLDEAMERAWEKRMQWKDIGIKAGNKLRRDMPANPIAFFNDKVTQLLGKEKA